MEQVKIILILFIAALGLSACEKSDVPQVKDPIEIESPSPERMITKVTLTAEQKAYVGAGNAFAINSLKLLYAQE